MIYLSDKTSLDLNTLSYLAKGGEALVYKIPQRGQVLKFYKEPDHPDYEGNHANQKSARERLIVQRQKLPALAALRLPSNVITPAALAYKDAAGRNLCGFTMRELPDTFPIKVLGNGKKQISMGITKNQMITLLRELYETVSRLHQQGVVVGDFNPLNILCQVSNDQIHHFMIDADSYQFDSFHCTTFTMEFADPLVCRVQPLLDEQGKPQINSNTGQPETQYTLYKPYTPLTDWYAFTTIMTHLLLYTSPYGGIHKPKSGEKRLNSLRDRIMQRATVFNDNVRYPDPSYDYRKLPDAVLDFLLKTFQKDARQVPTADLLDWQWTNCTKCGTEHARAVCPQCTNPSPIAVVQTVVVKDGVTAIREFETDGVILYATVQHGALRCVYNLNGRVYREDGSLLGSQRHNRYRIADNATFMGSGHNCIDSTRSRQTTLVDNVHGEPMFDVTDNSFYWVSNGAILRRKNNAASFIDHQIYDQIADGFANQTAIYMHRNIGLGWYMAGALPVAFVIHPEAKGAINFAMTAINGRVLQHTCHFGHKLIWFFIHYLKDGQETVRCTLLSHDGVIQNSFEEPIEPESWFKNIQNLCAIGPYLFAPTDEGIKRIENRGRISVTNVFKGTEPFVNSESQLLPGRDGIYVVNTHRITLLKL